MPHQSTVPVLRAMISRWTGSVQRVAYRAGCLHAGTGGEMRRFDAIVPHQVEYRLTAGQQMVGDDTAMTTPPDRLRAHHGGTPLTAECDEPFEASVEDI